MSRLVSHSGMFLRLDWCDPSSWRCHFRCRCWQLLILVEFLKLMFDQYLEAEDWLKTGSWNLVYISLLKFGFHWFRTQCLGPFCLYEYTLLYGGGICLIAFVPTWRHWEGGGWRAMCANAIGTIKDRKWPLNHVGSQMGIPWFSWKQNQLWP